MTIEGQPGQCVVVRGAATIEMQMSWPVPSIPFALVVQASVWVFGWLLKWDDVNYVNETDQTLLLGKSAPFT